MAPWSADHRLSCATSSHVTVGQRRRERSASPPLALTRTTGKDSAPQRTGCGLRGILTFRGAASEMRWTTFVSRREVIPRVLLALRLVFLGCSFTRGELHQAPGYWMQYRRSVRLAIGYSGMGRVEVLGASVGQQLEVLDVLVGALPIGESFQQDGRRDEVRGDEPVVLEEALPGLHGGAGNALPYAVLAWGFHRPSSGPVVDLGSLCGVVHLDIATGSVPELSGDSRHRPNLLAASLRQR